MASFDTESDQKGDRVQVKRDDHHGAYQYVHDHPKDKCEGQQDDDAEQEAHRFATAGTYSSVNRFWQLVADEVDDSEKGNQKQDCGHENYEQHGANQVPTEGKWKTRAYRVPSLVAIVRRAHAAPTKVKLAPLALHMSTPFVFLDSHSTLGTSSHVVG